MIDLEDEDIYVVELRETDSMRRPGAASSSPATFTPQP